MSPLVSVITVTFNCVATLARTLDSVRASKRADVEYVVVDGASTDGTLELLESNRDIIDVLISEPDQGIYDAMNKAVKHAHGDYVIFLNGDDQFIPAGFRGALDVLPKSGRAIETFTTLVRSEVQPSEVLAATPWKLLMFNTVPHPSTFTPRELQAGLEFDTTYRIAADYDMFLRAWVAGTRFHVHSLAIAVHHRGGASGDPIASTQELARAQRRRLPWLLRLIPRLHGLWQIVRG